MLGLQVKETSRWGRGPGEDGSWGHGSAGRVLGSGQASPGFLESEELEHHGGRRADTQGSYLEVQAQSN